MAGRPPKESLDFAGWSVSIFDNDPKIDKLLDAQGCIGFVIYFFLCQRAYGSHGYYYPWSCDDAATTAKKIGGGASSEAVINTVNLCFQVGLFNKDLHDRHKIITSRGIQKGYLPVILNRTNRSVIREYWLLNEEESAGLSFRALKSNLSPENANYHPSKLNYDAHIVEDSIEENSKVKKKERGAKKFAPPTLDEVTVYCHERGNNVDPKKFMDYFEASDWVDSKGNKVKNWKQKVITWEGSRTGSGNSDSSTRDDVFRRLKSETK